MKKVIRDDLDLLKIAESGQCFRWSAVNGYDNPAAIRIIAGSRVLFMEKTGGSEYDLSCSSEEFDGFWKDYLDLGTSYRKIRKLVSKEKDGYLFSASEAGKGIRILKQDPFESLISFIISQRKNIPAIRASIEKICRLAGDRISFSDSEKEWLSSRGLTCTEECFGFPSPEALASIRDNELDSCGTGYRTPYILSASRDVVSGITDPEAMDEMDDLELFDSLMKIYGVGKKVASCVCLFGFHRLDFFPVDVWIERVLSRHYSSGFPFADYAPYNGVLQQYMFFYERTGGVTENRPQ